MAASVKINSGIPNPYIFANLMHKDDAKCHLTRKCVGEWL
jgi:hypothetical protein